MLHFTYTFAAYSPFLQAEPFVRAQLSRSRKTRARPDQRAKSSANKMCKAASVNEEPKDSRGYNVFLKKQNKTK